MCLAAAMVHAQGSSGGILYASDFAAWSLPQGTGPASGTIAYPDPSICHVSSKGYNFVAPKVGRSLKILDSGVPANSETVVPTQVVVGPSGCTITATMAHTHLSYSVVSGTAGLQEAIDYQTGLPQGALVYLTPSWTLAGGVTSMITSAYGTTLVSILDERTAVIVPYTWNGSAYVAVPFAGGSTSWSSLTNATGALALTNTGHSSTFTQGSADGWTWQNTASTSAGTVEQDSPFLALAGMYYTGSADAADLWEIKDGIDTGTNGSSTLTFSHSGSSGAVTVAVPALTDTALTSTSLLYSASSALSNTVWSYYPTGGDPSNYCGQFASGLLNNKPCLQAITSGEGTISITPDELSFVNASDDDTVSVFSSLGIDLGQLSKVHTNGFGSSLSNVGLLTIGNAGIGSGSIQFNGGTSGYAEVAVAPVAGSPNEIYLPTATGISGQVLTTDGGNPQQTSWSTVGIGPSETYNATASGAITLPSADRSEATYVLTSDVTSTIAAGVGGAQITLIVCEAAANSYTWTWPASMSLVSDYGITPGYCVVLGTFTYLSWNGKWVLSGVGASATSYPYP
jgi:hypothetical protein